MVDTQTIFKGAFPFRLFLHNKSLEKMDLILPTVCCLTEETTRPNCKFISVFSEQAVVVFLQDLFLNKPIGLLALLDEESHFPQVGSCWYFVKICQPYVNFQLKPIELKLVR